MTSCLVSYLNSTFRQFYKHMYVLIFLIVNGCDSFPYNLVNKYVIVCAWFANLNLQNQTCECTNTTFLLYDRARVFFLFYFSIVFIVAADKYSEFRYLLVPLCFLRVKWVILEMSILFIGIVLHTQKHIHLSKEKVNYQTFHSVVSVL